MIDYAGLFKELMVADNMAFVRQIKAEQERKKQEQKSISDCLCNDCLCNGGGFAYCEVCHGE